METRELRYFVAVAEELHFSRAATRLGIAQPPLSRAISQLERRLGGVLLERNSRGVALTDAGRVLLAEARAALDAVDAAERRTRRATGDGEEPGLVLVSKAGAASELLTKLLDTYAAEPGAVKVEVVLCGIGEQGPRLRDGRADVALLHRPFDSTDGLDSEDLLTEGQVAVLPSSHPWATRPHLRLADLDDVPDVPPMRWPSGGGSFADGPGPEIHDTAQLYQLIGLGRAYTILPESARAEQHHGVATVPLLDAPEVTTVIAWPQHSRSLALAALVQAATRL
ncbi:MAG: LysR family transcriptional regulator [Nocardioides sp.]|uniref:LysR family transcriptional regulator n=1 Tax=Nocardioides sp. TaxID=35761 RepID=UPI003D6AAB89